MAISKITVNGTTNMDVTDTTAVASDVATGKYFYTAAGVRTAGTASGGNDFIVTISYNSTTQLWEPDCTVYEWQAAYAGGKNIVLNGDGCSIAGWFYDDDYSFIYGVYTGSSALNAVDLHQYSLTTQGLDDIGTETYILPTFDSPTRTYTPTTSQQTETITFNPSTHNGIQQVGVTVNAMPTGTAGTPTATKGSVSNHAVSVTPSVTNTTGYITGGTKTGTAVTVSASELVSGSETKTANGTYDVTNLAEVVVNVSGGASNIVQGKFTSSATRTGTTTVSVPYTGSGYPIAAMVFISGGAYNNSSGGNTTWYNSVDRYDVGVWYMSKARQNTAPGYTTSGADNYGVTAWIYKNNASTATTYSRSSSMTSNTYTSSSTNATSGGTCVRFKGNGKTLTVYTGNKSTSTYGFPPSTELQYIIVYSS